MGHKGVSKRKPKIKLNPASSVTASSGTQSASAHPFESIPALSGLRGRDANLLKNSQSPSGGTSKAHRKR